MNPIQYTLSVPGVKAFTASQVLYAGGHRV
jgi:hypothetical protein